MHDYSESVDKWKMDIGDKVTLPDGEPIPVILLGNKCDLKEQSEVTTIDMDEFAGEQDFASYFGTSAKSNINVEEAIEFLVQRIIESDQASYADQDTGRIRVTATGDTSESFCCLSS